MPSCQAGMIGSTKTERPERFESGYTQLSEEYVVAARLTSVGPVLGALDFFTLAVFSAVHLTIGVNDRACIDLARSLPTLCLACSPIARVAGLHATLAC